MNSSPANFTPCDIYLHFTTLVYFSRLRGLIGWGLNHIAWPWNPNSSFFWSFFFTEKSLNATTFTTWTTFTTPKHQSPRRGTCASDTDTTRRRSFEPNPELLNALFFPQLLRKTRGNGEFHGGFGWSSPLCWLDLSWTSFHPSSSVPSIFC